MHPYQKLFTEVSIRNLTIKNRICVPPMVCFNWSKEQGIVSDEHIEHYEELAAGGAGLIIQEATAVSPDGLLTPSELGIWDLGHLPRLRRIVSAVHRNGAKIFVQLHHAGLISCGDRHLCPSAVEVERKGVLYRGEEMTAEDIHRVQQDFVEAGVRAWEAGYDGVELHGCHSYLMSQFYNCRINRRSDQYGKYPGLFTLEILRELRKRVPDDFVIGIRLGAFEPTLDDAIAHAKALEFAGIDYLNISYGFSGYDQPFAPEQFPFRDVIYGALEIKRSVSVPVFAVNGIETPEQADEILQAGADMVCIGRAMLANPSWADDAKAGRPIVPCRHCRDCLWRRVPEFCPGKQEYRRQRLEESLNME